MIVPNQFPKIDSNTRIAIVGEAPGKDEDACGLPFVGYSGQLLDRLLSRAGISRQCCFVGNICQHQPPYNKLELFPWEGHQIQYGLQRLTEDLANYNPNIIILLGGSALKAAKPGKHKISNWRGSLFLGEPNTPMAGRKCIATLHPVYCLRDYEETAKLQLDLRKAARECLTSDLVLPQREYYVPQTKEQALAALQDYELSGKRLSTDIEGGSHMMSCISFANTPWRAVIIPFIRSGGSHYWSLDDERSILLAIARLLENPRIPKVLQAGLYDRFVLHYFYGIRVANQTDDSMVKHWSLYSELARDAEKKKGKKGMGLAMIASLYTREPYYKDERKSNDDQTSWEYCGKDSCIALEAVETIEQIQKGTSNYSFSTSEFGSQKTHYKLCMSLLNPLLFMELYGIRYDEKGASERRATLNTKLHEAQARLNSLAGVGFSFKSVSEIQSRVSELMLTKKGDRPLKAYEETYAQVQALLRQPSPDLASIGELENLCEVSLNVDSPKQFIYYLYETLKLPVCYKEIPRGSQEEPKPTADYEALLKLSRYLLTQSKEDPRLPILHLAIEIRALGTRAQMLSISADRDGRIRCGYNIVGSNTGRISCYESPTGSGYNLQTIPNYTETALAPGNILGDRDLFLSDPGYWFFQCDLKGADGWTVAAYAAMLGDQNMLDDYRGGVSPFEVLVLLLTGKPIPTERLELKAACKQWVKKDSWERFAMKRVQHGGCYLEGGLTISRNILKDSEGKLYLSPSECDKLKDYFFTRYWGVRKWHDWVARRLRERSILTAASGQVRQFFGRPDEILTKAVAFEPQANTTYATNLAMHNLWLDPANRQATGLRIKPLHQVHDALCGQFLQSDTPWAADQIKRYFANPLKIAGQDIIIPYDGAYGESWGNLNAGKL